MLLVGNSKQLWVLGPQSTAIENYEFVRCNNKQLIVLFLKNKEMKYRSFRINATLALTKEKRKEKKSLESNLP